MRTSRSKHRVATAAAVLALLGGACSGGDSDVATTSTSPTTSTTSTLTTTTAVPVTTLATTTTTSTTTTTAPPGDGAPPLDPVPADEADLAEFARIAREHVAYQNWIGLEPTVEMVVLGLVFHPDGSHYSDFESQMQSLLNDGAFREDDLSLDLVIPFPDSDASTGIIRLVVDFMRTRIAVIDVATGDVVVESTGARVFSGIIELRPDERGQWLIWDQRSS